MFPGVMKVIRMTRISQTCLLKHISLVNCNRLQKNTSTYQLQRSNVVNRSRHHCRHLSHHADHKTRHISVQDYRLDKIIDYEEEREWHDSFTQPERFNFARDVVDVWADKEIRGEEASTVALWVVNEDQQEVKLSFSDISILSKRFANVLTTCGLDREDCILVILHRVPEWWVINLATIRAGIVMIPGTVLLTAKDIEYRLKASGAKCVITSQEFVPAFEQAVSNVGKDVTKIIVGPTTSVHSDWLRYEDLVEKAQDSFECVDTLSTDPMLTYFTSGTTGLPKMTEHSHASYTLGHLTTTRFALNCLRGDVMYNMSDLGWAKAAYSSVYGPWMMGATILQHNVSKFNPDVTLQLMCEYPITNFCAPPTVYRQFITRDLTKYRFKALKHTRSAGEPVNAEILESWKNSTGLQIYEFYGQTETIVDKKGEVLPRGEEGEIGVRYRPQRPIGLFTRYVGAPEKTASVFVGDFYLTGDRAVMDDDGYVWFVGRSDDVILSSGYRIGPFEIESVLLEHPAVLESAVVSSPDATRGEIVKAFVILNESHKHRNKDEITEELQDYVKTATAPYKYPRKIEFVEELPKTVSGKIRRIELRQREWHQA